MVMYWYIHFIVIDTVWWYDFWICAWAFAPLGKVYFESQILECPSIGKYWTIPAVLVFKKKKKKRTPVIFYLHHASVIRSSQYWTVTRAPNILLCWVYYIVTYNRQVARKSNYTNRICRGESTHQHKWLWLSRWYCKLNCTVLYIYWYLLPLRIFFYKTDKQHHMSLCDTCDSLYFTLLK